MKQMLTKEDLDDIFYQGGPIEEEWDESDYDEAIWRVHTETIAAATPHIRAALYDELIAVAEVLAKDWSDNYKHTVVVSFLKSCRHKEQESQ